MLRLSLITVALSALAVPAHADKERSLDHYGKGKRAYADGKFDLALTELERAYAEFPAPEYLQNIGQALRRLGRCPEAITYFDKFLAAMPAAPNRAAIESQIAELRTQCPSKPVAAPIPTKPEVAAAKPVAVQPAPARVSPPATTAEASATVVKTAPAQNTPSPWSADASVGVLVLDAGPVVTPLLAQLRGAGHYRLPIRPVVRVGVAADLARLPYDDLQMGTAWIAGPQLTVETSVPLANRVSLVGGAAAGLRFVSGLGEGNPFTSDGRAADTFSLLLLRAEVGVAWRATSRIGVRVPVAAEYSPRRGPLAADVTSMRGLSVAVALDVRL